MSESVDIYRAELLAMSAGREDDGPVLVITMRPDTRIWTPYNFSFTPAQAQRMHADLSRLLGDPESWLHVPEEQQQETERE